MSSKKVPFNRHKENEEARKKVSGFSPFKTFIIHIHLFSLHTHFALSWFNWFWYVKREEDEAARVYAEFVESFKGETTSGSKFVRGGVIDPNAKLRADSEG